MRKAIYFFSGTGNSYRAARVIAEGLRDTDLISMRCDPAGVSALDAEVVGIVTPVYHWTLPERVESFLEGLKVNKDAYVFAISTPGFINGNVFERIDDILKAKGARLSYSKILYSVANLVVSYPAMPFPKLRVPAMERHIARLARDIPTRPRNGMKHPLAITRALYPKVMPKYRKLLSISDNGFIITDRCVSCGVCAKVCPRRNIALKDGKPAFAHNCALCMACVAYCPKAAIDFDSAGFKGKVGAEDEGTLNTLLIRRMKLGDFRKRYHNPHVTAGDLERDMTHID